MATLNHPAPGPDATKAPAAPSAFQRARTFFGVYGLFCAGALLLQFMVELRGWGFSAGERSLIPMSVRQSPGGYRSYHFWHRGLHGGK